MNKRLKELRKTLRLTQTEFAANLEMAQNSYSKIELGDNSLTEKNIFLICLIYGVNETWLRTGEGEMFNPLAKPKNEDEKQLLERAYQKFCVNDKISLERNPFFSKLNGELI